MEAEGSLPHSQVPATCPYPLLLNDFILCLFNGHYHHHYHHVHEGLGVFPVP